MPSPWCCGSFAVGLGREPEGISYRPSPSALTYWWGKAPWEGGEGGGFRAALPPSPALGWVIPKQPLWPPKEWLLAFGDSRRN